MLDKENFKTLLNYILVIGLFILAFLVVKPIIFAILYGILLAYILSPVHNFLVKKIKSKSLSSFIVCFFLLILLILLFVVIIGALFNQIMNAYSTFQQIDIQTLIQENLPFISSPETAEKISDTIGSAVTKMLGKLISGMGNFLLELPTFVLEIFIFFVVLFFALRDGEEGYKYLKSLIPFKKETHDKFFQHFKDITQSVLVGQIVVGVVQGVLAGVGYFVFGVPNALLLTVLTIFIGILPIIGPPVIWIPVDIYLFLDNKTGAAIGLLIYCSLVVTWIDNIIRPIIVARKTQINSSIVIIGMIGGLFMFGLIGLILGPLILAYVLLVVELYRKEHIGDDVIFMKPEENSGG